MHTHIPAPAGSTDSRETRRSLEHFEAAIRLIPGGVNSPVRAFRSVGGIPRFMARGEGCRVIDEDGNRYIDYLGAWGPLILGHRHPRVADALARVLQEGWAFGTATAREVRLAELVIAAFPGMERVRFVNSGTEACMTALRLARAATGRHRVEGAPGPLGPVVRRQLLHLLNSVPGSLLQNLEIRCNVRRGEPIRQTLRRLSRAHLLGDLPNS